MKIPPFFYPEIGTEYDCEFLGTIVNRRSHETVFVYHIFVARYTDIHLQKNLKSLMREHSLSLHQLSRRASVNKSTLHNYLNGVLPQGLTPLLKICRTLDVSIENLIFEEGVPSQSIKLPFSFEEGDYEVSIKKLR